MLLFNKNEIATALTALGIAFFGAAAWSSGEKIRVQRPTRLDWTFAVTRQSLTNPPPDLVGQDYRSTQQFYEFYRPGSASTADQPLPLILLISSNDQPDKWSEWQRFCQAESFLFAAPYDAGLKQPFAKRVRIILDVLDDVRQRQSVDPDRTYITGFEEAAHLACELGYSLPEYFGGILAINGGEPPPVPLWMQRRCAARLSVGFLSTERGKVATFTDALFHPLAVSAGIRSIHRQDHSKQGRDQQGILLREMFQWAEQAVQQRRELAAELASSRISNHVPVSRQAQASQVMFEAEQSLAEPDSIYAGLRGLEEVQQRWPDLQEATRARNLYQQWNQKAERPWEAESRKRNRDADAMARAAFLILHQQLLGIKADIRFQDRSRPTKNYKYEFLGNPRTRRRRHPTQLPRNYLEDYTAMQWDQSPAELDPHDAELHRFSGKNVELARDLGNLVTFDRVGRVRTLFLGGTHVTSKQIQSVRAKMDDFAGLCALDLSFAIMKDSVLYNITDLNELRAINLNHTSITDKGLAHVADLNQLQYLGLSFTDVSSLRHLRTLHNLRWLVLAGSKIRDSSLKNLEPLANLHSLSLFTTQISDAGVKHLELLPNLTYLNLAATKISDAGCKSLARFSPLQELVLDDASISDKGLFQLARLTNLRALSLEGTLITDEGLQSLASLQNLESLNVTNTQVTPQGIAAFRRKLRNCKVQWDQDPINYRAARRYRTALDRRMENEREVRRYALRELQRRLIGICWHSGAGLSLPQH